MLVTRAVLDRFWLPAFLDRIVDGAIILKIQGQVISGAPGATGIGRQAVGQVNHGQNNGAEPLGSGGRLFLHIPCGRTPLSSHVRNSAPGNHRGGSILRFFCGFYESELENVCLALATGSLNQRTAHVPAATAIQRDQTFGVKLFSAD